MATRILDFPRKANRLTDSRKAGYKVLGRRESSEMKLITHSSADKSDYFYCLIMHSTQRAVGLLGRYTHEAAFIDLK